ncbi:hypothetical protein N0V88_007759 [Collariella sp. IMI 366227]|nr:hypothetical protein N0V88_007759 [Collariella sp. IMI 366227]
MELRSIFRFLALSASVFTPGALAAFGYTSSGGNYVIDAGSVNPLIFSVSQSSCDIKSIKYRGTELQYGSQGTHIGSGLGSATVSISQIAGSSRYIKVTCVASTLTQYMVVREGESIIYMATYITAEPSIGELRFIARLLPDKLPNEYPYGAVSNTNGATSTVEGSDVFIVNGQTRSKFYSSTRFIDENSHCVYGGADLMHVCIMTPQQESSSGGPFFRDIDSNNAGASTNLYNYMNSGHVQTEAFRMGLHGPYVMQFSRSGIPSVKTLDVSWFGEVSITGWVPASGRGTVQGTATGIQTGLEGVVHWFNSAAQYWVRTSSTGVFTSPLMKPGTYTMVLYQTEFKIAATTISISAGQTTTQNIASTFSTTPRTTLFQIGEYDGQPTGFRNADKFLRMHPSDSRMASWGPLTYTVGASPLSDFPMALFQSVNNPVTINFKLATAPGAATLRIATTLSFAGSRPQATVNGWTAAAPAAPSKIDSRGVTRGAYRGHGEVYLVSVPAGKLVAGSNTVTISSVSGSSGTTFLGPNFIFDAVELDLEDAIHFHSVRYKLMINILFGSTILFISVWLIAGAPPADASRTANTAGLRLIKVSPEDSGRWVSEEDKIRKYKAKGIGFVDITDITDDKVLAAFSAPDSQENTFSAQAVTYPTSISRQTQVNSLLSQVSTTNAKTWLKTLTDFYNRYYKSTYGTQAGTWLLSTVKSVAAANSAITVSQFTHSFNQPSIIAKIPGTSSNLVIVSAHYDSTGGSSTARGPGADDNGSGVVVLLEALRVLASAKFAPKDTLEFHFYGGEEGGLLGSQAVFSSYKSAGKTVLAVVNQDMAGYSPSGKLSVYTDYVDAGLTGYVNVVAKGYVGATTSDTCGYGCSDHASARANGFPAAYVCDEPMDTSTPYIHTSNDAYSTIMWDAVLRHAKFTVAFLVEASYL